MNLALVGIDSPNLIERIKAIASALGLRAEVLDDESPWKQLTGAETDWELVILGPRLGGEDLPTRIGELIETHPADLAIVILEEERLEPMRAPCLRAGAFDVLSADAQTDALELAIGRAAKQCGRIARHQAAEKIQAISQLAIGVNHEINNPLTGLMGTAELIAMENQELPEKLRHDIKTILAQARRIQTVTHRLRRLDHIRTVPYDEGERMIDILGAAGAEAETELEPEPRAEAPREVIFETPRVLAIDDNPLIIDLITRALSRRFIIDLASSHQRALEKFKERPYDLVLLDLVMHAADERELIESIHHIRPGQRILITASYPDGDRLNRAIKAGAIGWIKKPFNFDGLEQKLWDWIRTDGVTIQNGN